MRQINPIDNRGTIQLKFSVSGKRYSFNPIPGGQYRSPRDFKTATAIATRIQNDVLADNFDRTLDRYRLVPKEKPRDVAYKDMISLWDAWVSTLDLPKATLAADYRAVRRQLEKAIPGLQDTAWLTRSSLAASTFNKRLKMVRSCYGWAVSEGILVANPWAKIGARKGSPRKATPFTLEEIQKILQGFQDRAPHYLPFVRFLLLTGVRTSEAIGLTWEAIDLEQGTLTISESTPRDRTGNGYKTVRKETKTGSIRILGISEELAGLLISLGRTSPEDLVFRTPNSFPIAIDNFRSRQWRPILEAVGVTYRNLYQTRHSWASHAIASGVPLTDVAYMLGHSDVSMVAKVYRKHLGRPGLPSLGI